MNYFIGCDIGTSAVKGALVTEDGKVITTASGKFTYTTEDNLKFLDPDHFCSVMYATIKELADQIGKDDKITAICSCCASGDPILLDAEFKPVTPIISWQSSCTEEELDQLWTKEEQEDMHRIVGWGCDTNMPSGSLTWYKLHRPEVFEQCAIVTMSCEYVNWKITGKWGLSHSMATPSFLVNQEKEEYEPLYLKKYGIEGKFLPPIYPKGTVLGTVKPEMAEVLGVSEDTVIVLGTFDHPSGAMGAGVLEEGQMLISCGTSWVEFLPVKDREFALSTGGLVDRFLLNGDAKFCVMKSVSSVADKINLLKAHYFPTLSFAEMDELILKAKPGCSGLSFTYTDEDYEAGKGYADCDIARAIYEGAAQKLMANLQYLRSCGLKPDRITMVGGITNSKVIMDVISETIGQELNTVNGQSAGAVGSALLAGMGVGRFKDEKDAFESFLKAN